MLAMRLTGRVLKTHSDDPIPSHHHPQRNRLPDHPQPIPPRNERRLVACRGQAARQAGDRAAVEGAQVGHRAEQVDSWGPSVASRHLPVPGRI
jgi:hypothetical protein